MHPLWASCHPLLQQLPQSTLPEVSDRGPGTLDRGTSKRASPDALRPGGLHTSSAARSTGFAEQENQLRSAIPRQCRNTSRSRSRSPTPRRGNRLLPPWSPRPHETTLYHKKSLRVSAHSVSLRLAIPQTTPFHFIKPCFGTSLLGEPTPGAVVELVVAHGRDQHDRLLAQPDRQEIQQLARGVIGPVQILEDEQQRGEPGEHPQDADEQPMPSRQHVAGAVVDQPADGGCGG